MTKDDVHEVRKNFSVGADIGDICGDRVIITALYILINLGRVTTRVRGLRTSKITMWFRRRV